MERVILRWVMIDSSLGSEGNVMRLSPSWRFWCGWWAGVMALCLRSFCC